MDPSTTTPDLSSLRIRKEMKDSPSGRGWPAWKIISLAAAVILVGLGYIFARDLLEGPRSVELVSASMTSPAQASAVLTASGYVVAQKKAAVASKGTGRLVFLGVEEGDKVKTGQVIARLEDTDVIAALDGARANLGVAQADLYDAEQSLERQKSLFDRQLTSKAELDVAEARARRVRANIKAFEASVRAAQVSLENTRIRAPFDGTVLTKNADVGEVVAPFAASASSRGAVVTIADMGSLQVEADVSESNITRVRLGQPAEITLDAYPGTRYRGKVHKIVPTADRAKATVLTKVVFLERDERVLPEMSAKVLFLSSGAEATEATMTPRLTVPSTAVVTRNSNTVVLRVRDGVANEVVVRTGDRIGNAIEIRDGLAAGDRVVAAPDPSLGNGTKVKPKGE